MSDRPEFTIEIHQNPYLPVAGTRVHAIARVRAKGDPAAMAAARHPAAEIIIVDTSGSMVGERLMAAKRAARAAVDALREDVHFAVVSGASDATMVYPRDRLLARAIPARKQEAHKAIARLSAGGGTRMGYWLTLAADLFDEDEHHIRHAVLLTDGKNEHETARELDAALERCTGRFVCDSRGVGADWEPAELRRISSRLLGGFDMVADPADLADDFAEMIERAMGKALADVALRVRTPHNASLRFIKQVYPSLRDLGEGTPVGGDAGGAGPSTVEFPTGIWGVEHRDYHLCVQVPEGACDQRMQAAQVSVVLPGDGQLASGKILAKWTDNESHSSRLHPSVQHYRHLEDLAEAVQRLREAVEAEDNEAAAREHRRARELAELTGNRDMAAALARITDPKSGSIQLSDQIPRLRIVDLDTQASESVKPPPNAEG